MPSRLDVGDIVGDVMYKQFNGSGNNWSGLSINLKTDFEVDFDPD